MKLDKTQTGKLTGGFQFNEVLQDLGDARAAAESYKEWCKNASLHTITINGETYTAELTPKFSQFAEEQNYYKLLEDFNTYDCITEEAAPQVDVQQVYPDGFEDILRAELSSQERYRQKQEKNQAFDKAMGEIESYLQNHTKADTVYYANQHGIKLGAKDKKLNAADKAKLKQMQKDGNAFSLPKTDSEGNQLSEDQQEYFAGSKARDENGNLYVMYHGSGSPVFTEFDVQEGVWLTPDQRYAEAYADMWHSWMDEGNAKSGLEQSVYADPDYRLYKMYANITNPLNLGEINDDFDRSQMNRLAKLLGVPTSRIRSLAYDRYGDQTVSFVYQVTKQKKFIDIARDKGYDGFTATEKGTKTFCAFSSPNQVKLTTNEVPSSFSDIRYSLPKRDQLYMDAVNRGDMETAQQMVNERAEELRAEVFAQTDVPTYRIRRGRTPQNTIKVYKVFTMSANGKPSALFVSSQYDLPVGVWLDAQDTYHFTDQKNGHQYVPSTKNPNTKGGATGRPTNVSDISAEDIEELEKRGYLKRDKNGKLPKTITSLAYRPGWHAGDLPFFPQGGMQIDGSNYPNVHRYNQVVFECEMIADNDYTDYHVTEDGRVQLHDMQEMPKDGSYKYSTNPMAQSSDIGAWYIGSSIKIVRALTQAECDRILQEKGRPVQEWQAYQDADELKRVKADARSQYQDKKSRDEAAKDAEYAYEHRYGTLDLDALGYDPTQTDGGKKLLDAVTYDDDGNVIPLSERFNSSKQDVRYSLPKSSNPYSYEELTRKPDMVVTTVGGNVPSNRADVIFQAKKNASSVGRFDPNTGNVIIHVNDIHTDVVIGRDGLKHSMDRRFNVNAPVVLKAGEILANSIRINELTPKSADASESYVLIGAAKNGNGDLYIVRSVVNRFSDELTSMDVLYAINAKKEPAALLPLRKSPRLSVFPIRRKWRERVCKAGHGDRKNITYT